MSDKILKIRSLESGGLPQANIVVTCTKRKRRSPRDPLRFRHIAKNSVEDGFSAWVDSINGTEDGTLPARELYAGDHWTVACSLEQVAASSGFRAAIWVCSAGYGLLHMDSLIKPYSATFSSSHPDTVCRWGDGKYRRNNKQMWWELLSQWPGPDTVAPRSIAGLAAAYPSDPLMVVASRDYMEGILADCREARNALEDPSLLSIVSAGSKDLPGLSANLIPSNVSSRGLVGGSVRAFNIRFTRKFLEEMDYQDLRAPMLHRKGNELAARSPGLPTISRSKTSEGDVWKFIWMSLEQDGLTGKTGLLRSFRDSGRACSQNRFSRIFESVVEAFLRSDR